MCKRREHLFGFFVSFFVVDFNQEHEQALKKRLTTEPATQSNFSWWNEIFSRESRIG